MQRWSKGLGIPCLPVIPVEVLLFTSTLPCKGGTNWSLVSTSTNFTRVKLPTPFTSYLSSYVASNSSVLTPLAWIVIEHMQTSLLSASPGESNPAISRELLLISTCIIVHVNLDYLPWITGLTQAFVLILSLGKCNKKSLSHKDIQQCGQCDSSCRNRKTGDFSSSFGFLRSCSCFNL